MIAIPRHTVDLTAYPDLVVIYLGMQVRSLRGLATFLQLGPEIDKSVAARPDGLLCHERIYYSLFPLHAGMRQYWRDFESLEKWTRELPHQRWWKKFLSAPLGVTFWHETYLMSGGMESVYLNMPDIAAGFKAFAPAVEARSSMFSARRRLRREGEGPAPVVAEEA